MKSKQDEWMNGRVDMGYGNSLNPVVGPVIHSSRMQPGRRAL